MPNNNVDDIQPGDRLRIMGDLSEVARVEFHPTGGRTLHLVHLQTAGRAAGRPVAVGAALLDALRRQGCAVRVIPGRAIPLAHGPGEPRRALRARPARTGRKGRPAAPLRAEKAA